MPLPAIRELSTVVTHATSAEEWIEALASGAAAPVRVERRRHSVRRHDWDALARRVAVTIAEGLRVELPDAGAPASIDFVPPTVHVT